METVSTSETSVDFYQTTRRNIREDGHIHTRRRENLKFYLKELVCFAISVSPSASNRAQTTGLISIKLGMMDKYLILSSRFDLI
jgi:hypothetical protein